MKTSFSTLPHSDRNSNSYDLSSDARDPNRHAQPVSFEYRALGSNNMETDKLHNTNKTGVNRIKENWKERIRKYLKMRN